MELSDLRSRMYRVGNYIKESTSKSLDSLKSDRKLGNLQDEINDAYRMLGYSIYTELKTINLESIFILTTQTADWFESQGFKADSVASLPEKRRKMWNEKRGSKVFRLFL